MITIFFLFLIVYAIGYLAGYFNNHNAEKFISQTGQTISQGIKKILPDNRIKPGILKRPSAKDLQERKVPQSVKDGREAMKETLATIPELIEHKRAIEEYNKGQGIWS